MPFFTRRLPTAGPQHLRDRACRKDLSRAAVLIGYSAGSQRQKDLPLYRSRQSRRRDALKGYLLKDERSNQVQIFSDETQDAKPIETAYRPLVVGPDATLLKCI